MIRFIAIFCISIISANAQEEIRRPWPPVYDYTPTGPFNPYTEKCCLGKISNVTNREWDRCCADEVYNQATELCCNGKRNKKENGHMCCGTTTYDTTNAICCQDQVVEVPSGDAAFSDCCGTQAYDTNDQLCCYDNELIVVNKTKECQNACCGRTPYDYNTQVCCYDQNGNGNKVLDKEGGKDSCCGDQLIDYTTEICCNNKVYENPDNTKQCCGNETIDTNKQACCYSENGPVVVPITKPGANSCCGKALYNPNNQICCGEKIYDGNYQEKGCCYTGGNVVAYCVKTQLCCYNQKIGESIIVNKTNPNQDSCCCTKPFDSTKEVCCAYSNPIEVYPLDDKPAVDPAVTKKPPKDDDCCTIAKKDTPDATQCCGKIAYSYSSGICCQANNQSKFYKYKPNEQYKYGCCGLKNYNYNEQICCNGKLTNRNQSNPYALECCNDKELYDTTKQICCIDWTQTPYTSKVYPSKNNVYCCGIDTYDYRTEMCCYNKKFKKEDNLQCCGNSTYDVTKETCCIDTIFKKDNCGQTDCCYKSTTDENNQCPYYPPIVYDKAEEKKKKK